MTKVYYHVIEEGSYDEIGSHGYYENYEDAKSECERLQEFFPDLFFYVYKSTSTEDPPICTI